MRKRNAIAILLLAVVTGCISLRPTESNVQRRHGLAYLNYWGPPYLTIPVAKEIEIEPYKGPDFDVYYFRRRMADTNTPLPATMGLYIGHHPQSLLQTQTVTEVTSVVLGSNRTWRCTSAESSGSRLFIKEAHLREVFAPRSAGSNLGGLIVHVWIRGTDTNEIALYEGMVRSLGVKR